jgi:subtilisin family serine protease
MNLRSLVWLLLGACLAIGMSFARPARGAGDADVAANRQILVMLRHPPDHYRANGAYGGGYGDELARSARAHLAQRIAHQYGLKLVESWPMPMIGVDCIVMAVPDGTMPSSAAERVSRDRDVAWAEPMQEYRGRGGQIVSHNDALYAAQPAASEWHLADLHRMATGRGTRVAVIDSGIDAIHPDLAGQLLVDENFVAGQALVAEQHGTAVAGIIAAKADNGIGIAGISPGTRLLGLRACWETRPGTASSTICDTLSLARALYFAVEKHPDVINLSLSGPDARLLRELITLAIAHGSVVVAAFDPKLPNGGFPASVSGVLAVSDNVLAPSRGQVYTAPGRDVPTTEPGGRWFIVNGSSFAAAHVSGLVALMRERRRSGAPMIVSQRRGGGFIDACETMLRIAGSCDCSCSPSHLASAAQHR